MSLVFIIIVELTKLANLSLARLILPPWFDYLRDSFSYNKVQFSCKPVSEYRHMLLIPIKTLIMKSLDLNLRVHDWVMKYWSLKSTKEPSFTGSEDMIDDRSYICNLSSFETAMISMRSLNLDDQLFVHYSFSAVQINGHSYYLILPARWIVCLLFFLCSSNKWSFILFNSTS